LNILKNVPDRGFYQPGSGCGKVTGELFTNLHMLQAKDYQDVLEILQLLEASGFMTILTKTDIYSEARPWRSRAYDEFPLLQ
jgi:hypothetical protein